MKRLELNLAIQNKAEVTILNNGECFMSQRIVASELGVDQSSISRFCASRILDIKQGVTPEILELLITHQDSWLAVTQA